MAQGGQGQVYEPEKCKNSIIPRITTLLQYLRLFMYRSREPCVASMILLPCVLMMAAQGSKNSYSFRGIRKIAKVVEFSTSAISNSKADAGWMR